MAFNDILVASSEKPEKSAKMFWKFNFSSGAKVFPF